MFNYRPTAIGRYKHMSDDNVTTVGRIVFSQ